jgi:predicted phosphodiesterase
MFVVSDLHVVGADTAAHKHESFSNNIDSDGRLRTPFNRLDVLIDRDEITADIVVCCGDLTNRAGKDGFVHGWDRLEQLTRKLKASTLIFTPGNHDLDVRNIHGTGDPRVCLKSVVRETSLEPTAATGHRLATDHFELHILHPEVLVLVIDSNGPTPTLHGGKTGEISIDTVDMIDTAIASIADAPQYGVVVCHHHPYRHGDIDLADYSELKGAPELLNMLRRHRSTDWLIVHGHKHYPRVTRVGDFTVFAAGSFSGSLHGIQATVARNQCYLISIVRDAALGDAHPPVGKVQAWDWAGVQWIDALGGFGIPSLGGFGSRGDLRTLTAEVARFVMEGHLGVRAAEDVVTEFAAIRYLMPDDETELRRALKRDHDVTVLIDSESGAWKRLGVNP